MINTKIQIYYLKNSFILNTFFFKYLKLFFIYVKQILFFNYYLIQCFEINYIYIVIPNIK